ncbi:MAG: acyl-CoA dehydrogenase [Kineosporiaceae bacterium]
MSGGPGAPRPPVPGPESPVEAVGRVLADGDTRAALERLRAAGPGADPREVYRVLGRHRLLAPHWSVAEGGRGAASVDSALVVDAMVRAGVPDTLHTLSLSVVGNLVRASGTPRQRADLLPTLAAGERFATVLYSEPSAGSDLAALETSAVPCGDEWSLRGRKVYSVQTQFADLALVLARTSGAPGQPSGLTLFLVPLDTPGVDVRVWPGMADEPFADVLLDDVRVPDSTVLGTRGAAWPLVTDALVLERTGVEQQARGRLWLDHGARVLAGAGAAAEPDPHDLAVLGGLGARQAAGRLLALAVCRSIDAGRPDPAAAAASKWYASETALAAARWLAELGATATWVPEATRTLADAAYREAPGLTVSAGTSEMMLHTIAGTVLDGAGTGDPLEPLDAAARCAATRPELQGVARAVRDVVGARSDDDAAIRTALADLGVRDLVSGAGDAAAGPGAAAAVAVAEALGAAGAPSCLLDDLLPDLPALGGGPVAQPAVRLCQAGYLVGMAGRALDLAVAHARRRRQFGGSLLAHQAVAFPLAAALVEVAAAGRLVEATARRPGAVAPEGPDPDSGPPEGDDDTAVEALALAAETATSVTALALHVHGAFGLTREASVHDLHRRVVVEANRHDRPALLWRRAGRARVRALAPGGTR